MEKKIILDSITQLNHNVVHLVCQKPAEYHFTPGQATEVALAKPEWKDEKRPFTFTSLPDSEALEFVIKSYPAHDGVTEQIPPLEPGDALLIGDAWGAIEYKGPGVFIAGGAGVTPFIAILRDLAEKGKTKGNKLLFANKKEHDIFYAAHFESWLGENFVNILSEEKTDVYAHGRIDRDFLESQTDTLDQYFYVCGPPEMIEDVVGYLKDMGVKKDKIITEDMD
ncbi:MAG: flavodoxin reductase [Pricia sp.]